MSKENILKQIAAIISNPNFAADPALVSELARLSPLCSELSMEDIRRQSAEAYASKVGFVEGTKSFEAYVAFQVEIHEKRLCWWGGTDFLKEEHKSSAFGHKAAVDKLLTVLREDGGPAATKLIQGIESLQGRSVLLGPIAYAIGEYRRSLGVEERKVWDKAMTIADGTDHGFFGVWPVQNYSEGRDNPNDVIDAMKAFEPGKL